MKHKERIRAVLNGEPVDRLPVSTWGHDFLREWSAEELAAHTIERQEKYDYDFVKLNPRWTMFAEPWGNEYQPPTEQKFPRLTHKIVNSAEDLGEVPEVAADHPVFQEHIEALRLVLAEIGDDVDVVVTIFSPLSVIGLLCGGVGEPLVSYAREKPELLHSALKHVTRTIGEHAEQLVAAGASGVFFAPLQWTSLDICNDDFYNEFGRPYDLEVLSRVEAAPLNILHVCGNNIGLDRFLDYPVPVFNWDNFGPGNLSLKEASAKTDKIVAGGIPHRKLHKLDANELGSIAADSVAGLKERVMLTGGCGVGAMVGDEIRQAVVQVADTLK